MRLGGFSISCSKLHSANLFTFFCVYKSYHYGFKYYMYLQALIQTHDCVIQSFISCHQDSYCQTDIDSYHKNYIQYFHLLPLQHLLYYKLQDYFIPCVFKTIIVLLLPFKFISICVMLPMVLSRPTFSILRTKVSQDIAFIL